MKSLRGFAILSAIFILVVLAALGAFILSVSSQQQIGSALDVQGARAYQAARAGIEWGVYQVQSTANYNFSYGNPATAVGAANPNLRSCATANSSFDALGFRVTVTCTRTPVDDAPANNPNNSPAVYSLQATACNQANAGACPNTDSPGNLYIERRLTVTF